MFRYNTGKGILIESGGGSQATAGNVIRDNTFIDTRGSHGEPTIHLADDYGRGCYNNRIVGNSIRNLGADRGGVIHQNTTTGANFARDNVIVCGDAPPFVVLAGRLVRSGNRIQ